MRRARKNTDPDVAFDRAETDVLGAGLLRVAENHARGFSGRTGAADGDFAIGVTLAVFQDIEELGLGNDAGFGIAVQHVFDRDEGGVIDLVAEADEQAVTLADQMHGRHAITFHETAWDQHGAAELDAGGGEHRASPLSGYDGGNVIKGDVAQALQTGSDFFSGAALQFEGIVQLQIGDDAAGQHHEAHGHGGANRRRAVIFVETSEQMLLDGFLETTWAAEPLLFEPESGGAAQHVSPTCTGAALGMRAAGNELLPCDGTFPLDFRNPVHGSLLQEK